MNMLELTKETFEAEVLKAEGKVLVRRKSELRLSEC